MLAHCVPNPSTELPTLMMLSFDGSWNECQQGDGDGFVVETLAFDICKKTDYYENIICILFRINVLFQCYRSLHSTLRSKTVFPTISTLKWCLSLSKEVQILIRIFLNFLQQLLQSLFILNVPM